MVELNDVLRKGNLLLFAPWYIPYGSHQWINNLFNQSHSGMFIIVSMDTVQVVGNGGGTPFLRFSPQCSHWSSLPSIIHSGWTICENNRIAIFLLKFLIFCITPLAHCIRPLTDLIDFAWGDPDRSVGSVSCVQKLRTFLLFRLWRIRQPIRLWLHLAPSANTTRPSVRHALRRPLTDGCSGQAALLTKQAIHN